MLKATVLLTTVSVTTALPLVDDFNVIFQTQEYTCDHGCTPTEQQGTTELYADNELYNVEVADGVWSVTYTGSASPCTNLAAAIHGANLAGLDTTSLDAIAAFVVDLGKSTDQMWFDSNGDTPLLTANIGASAEGATTTHGLFTDDGCTNAVNALHMPHTGNVNIDPISLCDLPLAAADQAAYCSVGDGGGGGSCDSLSTAAEYQAAGCCNC